MRSANPLIPSVLLVPLNDLHAGVHWSIIDSLWSQFRFMSPETKHWFIQKDGILRSPYNDYCIGEFLEPGRGSEIVHSSKWPVIGRKGWIVDHDDAISATLIGRYALNPNAQILFKSMQEPFVTWMHRRFENMIAAYCHPSCTAVLFWTKAAKRWAIELCRKIAPQYVALLEKKSQVVYFVPRPRPYQVVARKWSDSKRTIIFCGLDYKQKNGAIALKIFSRLIDQFPSLNYVYIGNIPGSVKQKYASLLNRIEYHEFVSRNELTHLFDRSHILFHPSLVESYGSVFVEAISSGMAIVTAKGRWMEHIPELVSENGAYIVDRYQINSEAEEEIIFENMLTQLIIDRSQADKLGWHNYQEITDGHLSWRKMCEKLRQIYWECSVNAQVGGDELTLDDLPYSGYSNNLTMSPSEVMKDQKYWRAAWNLSSEAIIFDVYDVIS